MLCGCVERLLLRACPFTLHPLPLPAAARRRFYLRPLADEGVGAFFVADGACRPVAGDEGG
ncbi:MAG: hypothetical protein IKH84_05135, partial [Ottowia sp.]|nr:hypothetical protein [Ottowia sp.]